MTKHFEKIWEEAEQVAKDYYFLKYKNEPFKGVAIDLVLKDINNILKDNANNASYFGINIGKILMALCFCSEHFNINVYKELKKITEDYKLELLEDGEEKE